MLIRRTGDQIITAYALSLNGKSQIIFCKPFFELMSLDEMKTDIEKNWPKGKKQLPYFKTRAHVFFHEMTHLSRIEGESKGMLTTRRTPFDIRDNDTLQLL
jgi:hypothetical protein